MITPQLGLEYNTIQFSFSLDVLIKVDVAIRSGGEQPWLAGMEHRCQDAKLLDHLVTSQNFDRDQERIAHQVGEHHGMIDVDSAVVGRGRHQRVAVVERYRSDGAFVVFERLIRCVAKIQIEPN